jgi:hypothetical protein
MTEAKWLVTTDVFAVLRVNGQQKSVRKWRLFAIACCRRVWPDLSDWARESLAVLESVAAEELDGAARAEVMKAAPRPESYGDRAVWKAIRPGKEAREFARDLIPRHVLSAGGGTHGSQLREQMSSDLAHAARDIFGHPRRRASLAVSLTPDVIRLARAAFAERLLPTGELDRGRLGILSDALEEAGCSDAGLLGHLRSTGAHVRGCWAVDLVLGKR